MPSRIEEEVWTGPDATAQELIAALAVAPWTAWTLLSQTPEATTVHRTRPYSLREDLIEDGRLEMRQLALDMVGGLPWPTTIDEWRSRWSPLGAINIRLTRAGVTPSSVSLAARQMAAHVLEQLSHAIIYFHNRVPGSPPE